MQITISNELLLIIASRWSDRRASFLIPAARSR
jgi:hypothetical protein